MGEAIAFYVLAACILGFAVLVITAQNTVHCVLFLVANFLFVGTVWTLGQATEPVRTRAPEPASDAEAAELDQAPLGQRSFRLQQVYGAPAGWMGQKVAAKGFLTRSGTEERVNVTSMRTLATPCP